MNGPAGALGRTAAAKKPAAAQPRATVTVTAAAPAVVVNTSGVWMGTQTNHGGDPDQSLSMNLVQASDGSVEGAITWRTASGRIASYRAKGAMHDGNQLRLEGYGGWVIDPGIAAATLDAFDLTVTGSTMSGSVVGAYGPDGGNWGEVMLTKTG